MNNLPEVVIVLVAIVLVVIATTDDNPFYESFQFPEPIRRWWSDFEYRCTNWGCFNTEYISGGLGWAL
jgi:hypothetical protein